MMLFASVLKPRMSATGQIRMDWPCAPEDVVG